MNSCDFGQDQTSLEITSLPSSKDYIFYSDYENSTDYKIWAINSIELSPILITSELVLRNWSPSNNFLLLTGNRSIYLANGDGSGIRKVYSFKDLYKGVDPFWLTDDIILFNAYEDYFFLPPDMYKLSIRSGKVTQLFPGENGFIQSVFPSERKWVLASWPSGPLRIVDKSENTEEFFDDFSIVTNPHAPYQPIQRADGIDKYLVQAKSSKDLTYKLWLLSGRETPQMFFDPKDEGVDQFAISPNEKHMALTYNSVKLKGVYLYVFSMEDFQMTKSCLYPYAIGSGYFKWSPDSKSIVLHYSESDVGVPTQVNFGIQIMDIATCETKIILKEDVSFIIDWHFIGEK